MADTKRNYTGLSAIFPDNSTQQITPQDLRDGFKSVTGSFLLSSYTNDATLTLANAIDLSDKSSAELTFSWYIESGFDSGEYIALDVYDGTWNQVMSLDGNSDPENTWHHETVNLGSYLASNFKIRFRSPSSSTSFCC